MGGFLLQEDWLIAGLPKINHPNNPEGMKLL